MYSHYLLLQPETVPVITVTSQPTISVVDMGISSHSDHYFMLSILLSVICCCCGSWLSLLCAIPAMRYGDVSVQIVCTIFHLIRANDM